MNYINVQVSMCFSSQARLPCKIGWKDFRNEILVRLGSRRSRNMFDFSSCGWPERGGLHAVCQSCLVHFVHFFFLWLKALSVRLARPVCPPLILSHQAVPCRQHPSLQIYRYMFIFMFSRYSGSKRSEGLKVKCAVNIFVLMHSFCVETD